MDTGTGSGLDSPNNNNANSNSNLTKNLKHFKKAFIVEYERIESNHVNQEDSQSSLSSVSSNSSSNNSSSNLSSNNAPISFANSSISDKNKKEDNKNMYKRKLDLYDNEPENQTTNEEEEEEDYEDKISDSSEKMNKKKDKKKSSTSSKSKSKNSNPKRKKMEHKPETDQSQKVQKKDNNANKNKKIYCICKSADTKRFMIACDNCDEWYHGDCVGVTQSLSKKIKAFFCHLCRNEKSSLKIKYKTKYQDVLNNKNTSSNDPVSAKFLKETQQLFKKEAELLKKIQKKESKSQNSNSTSSNSATNNNNNETSSTITKSLQISSSTNETKYYGKTNISGEDIENFVSAITKLNDNAHRESLEMQKTNKPKTDHDYTNKTDNLETDQDLTSNHSSNENSDSSVTETESETESDQSEEYEDDEDNNSDLNEPRIKSKSKSDDSTNKSKSKLKPSKIKEQKQKQNKSKSKQKQTKKNKKLPVTEPSQQQRTSRRTRLNSSSQKQQEVDKATEPEQCLGPECVNEAQKNSKYCSDECGMNLAKNRLCSYLKTRLDQFNETECLSDSINLNELDRINSEIDKMRKKLVELEQKHVDLDKIIERAKYSKINPNIEKDRDKQLESNRDEQTEIYCVSCGIQCSEKHALKHMEKCFNKIESQAFFGSFYKTHIDGKSMFCDYYNQQTKMYCKRLKVMCPEHEKEKKINDDEVCGYPLPKPNNIFQDSENELCLAPKRTCSVHFKWEKLRRAQIDLEKLRTWLKLEELVEQKRLNESSLNQRKGLLSILLHQTIIHNPNNNSNIQLQNDTNNTNNNTSLTNSNEIIQSNAEAQIRA